MTQPADQIMQIITMIVAIAALLSVVFLMVKIKKERYDEISTLIWVTHTVIYYVAINITDLLNIYRPFSFMQWSVILRLHTLVSIVFYVFWKIWRVNHERKHNA